jgi:hypothetical protein
MGRRADDAELIQFVQDTLGQRVPNSTTDVTRYKHVVAKKLGVALAFDHDVKNSKYPLIAKSKTSFLPYLKIAWLDPKLPDPLPFGLRFGMSVEEISRAMGDPAGEIGSMSSRRPYWQPVLDPARDILFRAESKQFLIKIDQALELTRRWESGPRVGLLVEWLAYRHLLDSAAFPEHGALVDAVSKRAERGSKLVKAALPRGLWDIHLKDLPGLRPFAYEWMHNIDGKYIRDDLVSVFGSREGSHGHAEPVLDDDDWPAVDRATPVLDRRFSEWRPADRD